MWKIEKYGLRGDIQSVTRSSRGDYRIKVGDDEIIHSQYLPTRVQILPAPVGEYELLMLENWADGTQQYSRHGILAFRLEVNAEGEVDSVTPVVAGGYITEPRDCIVADLARGMCWTVYENEPCPDLDAMKEGVAQDYLERRQAEREAVRKAA